MSNLHASLYVPKEEDIFLFDTNILIYIFYPVMNSFSTKTYVTLYTQALKNKCTLVLPAIQLSEFINRCIRFQFELYRDTQDKNAIIDFKKDYRSTDDYRESMNSILDIVKNDIFPNFTLVDDQFCSIDSDSILKYGFSYDFNDAFLVQIANQNDAYIVTHDADFGNYHTKLPIITDNRLLALFNTK